LTGLTGIADSPSGETSNVAIVHLLLGKAFPEDPDLASLI